MKNITGYSYFQMNGRWVVMLGEEYNGSPTLAWVPDVLITTEEIYSRYVSSWPRQHTEIKQIIFI